MLFVGGVNEEMVLGLCLVYDEFKSPFDGDAILAVRGVQSCYVFAMMFQEYRAVDSP